MVTQYSRRIPASNVVFVVSAVAIKDVGPPPYQGIWKLLLGGDAAAKIGKLLDPNVPKGWPGETVRGLGQLCAGRPSRKATCASLSVRQARL